MTDTPVSRCGPDGGGNYEYHWTNHRIEAHFISDVGKKRQHNEDSCILSVGTRGALFAVADGMGGASAGEFASRLALSALTREFHTRDAGDGNIPAQLRESVERANASIFKEAEGNPAYHGMGTTVSAMLIAGDCAYFAHVGDSRVYLSRGKNTFCQLTEDHSLVAEQVRSGIISEEEARTHSLKNLITRAVGIKEFVEVDVFSLRLKKGDTILICSDGLSNLVEYEDIADSLRMDSLQGAARILVGKALEGGGNDNISVIVVRVNDTPIRSAIHDGCEELSIPGNGFFGRLRRFIT